MTAREMQKRLRRRKKQLRQELATGRREHERRVAALPAVRRARRRRQARRAGLVAVLLAVLAVARCDCQSAPADVESQVTVPKPTAPVAKSTTLPPLDGTLETRRRAGYAGESPAPRTWVDEFRIQVAARSPRLAECFQGSERPGALRWTAAVSPDSGMVSQHELEPLGVTGDIGVAQRDCLIAALSTPHYQLQAGASGALSTPVRVGIVIEF
jgi:hypothetical protein